MIAALRRETAKNAVSPELLGSILKSIVDLIDGTVDNANLDTGSGSSAHSNTFGGQVEDDTYTPITVSDLEVVLEQGASRTLTMNRTAEEVLLSAYDDSIVNVIVADGTITVVALQEDGSTEFSISDEGGSVTVRVKVGEAVAPDLPLSEVEKLLLDKQDRIVGVREENLSVDYLRGCELKLKSYNTVSPLVAVQSGDAGELSQGIYLEKGETIRAYRQTEVEAFSAIVIAMIYGEEMEAGQFGVAMESVDEGDLEFVVPFSGYYAFSGLQEIDHLTKDVPVTVEEVLAMKQDKVNGKGLSTNDYTTAEKNKLAALPTKARYDTDMAGKQSKLPLKTGTGEYSLTSDNSYGTAAQGKMSFAYGRENSSMGELTITLGRGNTGYGYCSVSLGRENYSNKDYTLAFGMYNDVQGWGSICIGHHLRADNEKEAIFGMYNLTKTGLIFSVGCGTSSTNRKNAIEVDANGLVSFPQSNTSVAGILTAVDNAKKIIPNDVSRTQNDATFVRSENGTLTPLFYLRQATSSLAGLMTATDKAKLDGLPTNAQLTQALSNIDANNVSVDYRALNSQPYTTLSAALGKIANDIADFEQRIAALEGNS